MKISRFVLPLLLLLVTPNMLYAASDDEQAQAKKQRAEYIRYNYSKYEYEIPMRDGTTLFTSVLVPNDKSKTYPILMVRTPYSVSPYGLDKYLERVGPGKVFEEEGFIFVSQDVRGQFRSEGEFVNVRPQDAYKRGKGAVDDATDSYDTIDWLVKNIPGNNGKVGIWGISYPGYYAAVASINAHPALKAVSPQAPVTDWFFDDFFRNGVFVPSMAFFFFDRMDNPPEGKHSHWAEQESKPWTHDGYDFFLEMGPLSNMQKHFEKQRPFLNEMFEHPNYDEYWQARNILQHLGKTRPATMVVGGWYDTEDLYGPLYTYQTMSNNNRNEHVRLVMGPWYHGQWASDDGSTMGEAQFGFNTSKWFQEDVLLPFFKEHLKDDNDKPLYTATMFETGANRWRTFEQWPPQQVSKKTLYFADGERLVESVADNGGGSSEYISDPNKPVPHSKAIGRGWDRPYMTEDQRFAARRPDVLVFNSDVLEEDLTLAGALNLDLKVSTTASAADFVVKLVDVFPGKNENTDKLDMERGNRHELVRWGSIRGRFRESVSEPKPFTPDEVTTVKFELYDVLHTFKRGHKIQIQVQSTMFPFLDRNPQKYVDNIFNAEEKDFIKATHRLYHNDKDVSSVEVSILQTLR